MKRVLLGMSLVAVAAAALGYLAGSATRHDSAPAASPHAQRQAVYVCPMHPHIVQAQPGSCPICGMDLVGAQGSLAGVANQIHVDTATQQRFGVRLAPAERMRLTHAVRTYGTVVPQEGAVSRLTPSIDGVLTRLYVSHVGERIATGQPLYEISSDALVALQNEYIDVVRRAVPAQKMAEERRAQHARVRAEAQDDAAREQAERGIVQSEEQLYSILQPLERDRERAALRLKQIGFSDAMLAQIVERRHALMPVVIRARAPCLVQEVLARSGMHISAMTEILACADPGKSQLEIMLYPDALDWVATGDAVEVEFGDGRTLKAALPPLPPLVERDTRGVRVYLPLTLPVHLGATARVTIAASPREVLAVPKTALLRTGRGNFVMRALDQGHFMPVEVVTGIETDTHVAIRAGLAQGDRVAVNGQFLLDAAASLADAAQRLSRDPAAR